MLPRNEAIVQELALFQSLKQRRSDDAASMVSAPHGKTNPPCGNGAARSARATHGEGCRCPSKLPSICHTTETFPGYELWRGRIGIERALES